MNFLLPTLIILFFIVTANSVQGQELPIIRLTPTHDAFVVTDLKDPEDPHGLQKLNTGDRVFLKAWYAWNVTENQEKMASISYLKFDLSGIEADKVLSANLKLTPKAFDRRDKSLVNIFAAENNDWKEDTITYITKPDFSPEPIASKKIITGLSHSFDVTNSVKNNAGSEITFAAEISTMNLNSEELITFNSKEFTEKENIPILEIILSDGISETIQGQDFEESNSVFMISGLSLLGGGVIGFLIALFVKNKKTYSSSNKR